MATKAEKQAILDATDGSVKCFYDLINLLSEVVPDEHHSAVKYALTRCAKANDKKHKAIQAAVPGLGHQKIDIELAPAAFGWKTYP